MDIRDIALRLLGVLIAGLSLVHGSCQRATVILPRLQECLHTLDQPTNLTLSGKLTQATLDPSCKSYQKTLKCVLGLVSSCRTGSSEWRVGQSLLKALRGGMGQLCEDRRTFNDYRRHAPCYQNHQTDAYHCQHQFSMILDRVFAENPVEDGRGNASSQMRVCRGVQKMIDCLHDVLGYPCSQAGARLYGELVRAQVPSIVTSLCDQRTGKSSRHQAKNKGNSGPVKITNREFIYLVIHMSITYVAFSIFQVQTR